MKRFISLAMLAIMATAIVACSNTDGKNKDTSAANASSNASEVKSLPVLSPDHPVELTAFVPTGRPAPAKDNKIAKLLKDKLGVTLQMEIVPTSNLEEKIGVMIAGGDYPDLIGAVDLNAKFLEAGAALPLDDYLTPDLANNLYEHIEPYRKRLSYKDGHLYIVPNYNRFYGEITGGTFYGSGFYIQKAVLEEFGYPEVKTLDDYFGLIEKYKEKYPTIDGQPTIGFEVLAAPGKEFVLLNPPEHLAGYPNDGGVIVDDGVAKIFADKDIAKNYYQYLNEMNAKGLIDKESFTQTYDQYLSKLASGRVLGMFDQRWNFGNAYDALIQQNKENRTWVATMPVYEGKTPYYRDRDVMNLNQGFAVSATSDKKEIAISLLNTLLEEDWQKTLSWGIEGEDYLVDDNGRFYRTEQQRRDREDEVWRSTNRYEAFFDVAPKHQGTYSDGNAFGPAEQPEEFFDSLKPYDQNFLKAYNKQTWMDFVNDPPENPVYYPAWSIALPDGSDAQMASSELVDAGVQYLPRAILAKPEEFETVWSEYVNAIGKINSKAYEDYYTEEIQRRIKEWSE